MTARTCPSARSCCSLTARSSRCWSCASWRSCGRRQRWPERIMSLRDDLLSPIAGTTPGGIELRYDPIFDKIKEARREDLDAPQGEWATTLKTADWPLVIKLAKDAIATKSKDLQIAAWLTEALARREGFPGLRSGLEVLAGLVEVHWDNLYPEIDDGDAEMRAAPLEWVGTKL